MRLAVVVLVGWVGTTYAEEKEPPTRYAPGETIVIRSTAPPSVLPRPKKNYIQIVPPYSDEAIDRDTWTRAWVLLDIDTRGVVQRVKLLNAPGMDLDDIAVSHAMKMRFEPAQDAHGKPMPVQLVWTMEWPAHWWMVAMDLPPNRVPDNAPLVKCKGAGPLQFERIRPTLRDCSKPDLAKIETAAWRTK